MESPTCKARNPTVAEAERAPTATQAVGIANAVAAAFAAVLLF